MREWTFENGITVLECEFDHDLHILKVYHEDKYLGGIYPADIDDMNKLFDELDGGSNPIDDRWENGAGETCTIEGWE